MEFFKVKFRDLDRQKTGVNVQLKSGANVEKVKVSLDLWGISGLDALCYFADLADLKVVAGLESLTLEKVK